MSAQSSETPLFQMLPLLSFHLSFLTAYIACLDLLPHPTPNTHVTSGPLSVLSDINLKGRILVCIVVLSAPTVIFFFKKSWWLCMDAFVFPSIVFCCQLCKMTVALRENNERSKTYKKMFPSKHEFICKMWLVWYQKKQGIPQAIGLRIPPALCTPSEKALHHPSQTV